MQKACENVCRMQKKYLAVELIESYQGIFLIFSSFSLFLISFLLVQPLIYIFLYELKFINSNLLNAAVIYKTRSRTFVS